MKDTSTLTAKQQKRLAALALVIFAVVTAALVWLVGGPLLRYAREPERFRLWVESHGLLGPFAYMGMVLIQVLVAVIPGEPLEILGGYAFGAWTGTALCLLAATLGSLAVFFLVRRFGVPLVEVFFPREKWENLRFLRSSPRRDVLFLLIFMIPGTPKDLLCYFAGLTDIRFPVWLLICSLGRIPSVITSTLGGSALGSKSYWYAAVVFAVTLCISLAGLWVYRCICRRHDRRQAEAAEAAAQEASADPAEQAGEQENGSR